MTTSEAIAGWRAGLDALHAQIGHRFRRAEARERAKRYLAGLLDRVERKNGWQLAEHLGEAGPQGVQRLLNAADWDVDAVRDDLRAYVTEHLGEPTGVWGGGAGGRGGGGRSGWGGGGVGARGGAVGGRVRWGLCG